MQHILRDIQVEFNKDQILLRQGRNADRVMSRPKLAETFDEVLAEIPHFIHPMAVWDTFSIQAFKHDQVILTNGIQFGGGPLVEVIGGAEEIAIGMCTLGIDVDKRIEFYQKDSMTKALFFDSMASWATGVVREHLIFDIKKYYQEHKKHTSITLSPGESSWDIKDQRKIFALVDTTTIGLTLNESCLMVPMKSISLIIGAGSHPINMEKGSRCRFCMMRDKCDHSELHHNIM